MIRLGLMTLVAVLASFAVAAQTRGPYPSVFAIRAGTLIDPETGTSSSNQTIVVESGKIKAVGGKVDVPPGATTIDLSRSAVMPGLFDAHTHLCMDVNVVRDAGSYFLTTLFDSDADRAIQGTVPRLGEFPPGCAFAPRCPRRFEPCPTAHPGVTDFGNSQLVKCYLHGTAVEPEVLRARPAVVEGTT